MDCLKLAKENENYAINVRRCLHRIPEICLDLPKTVAYICSELDKMSVKYEKLINGNAIVATIYGEASGPSNTLAIRADMDALPICEETGLDFTSEHDGFMHACGHDAHAAIALTTLKILNENKDKFSGAVKFLFQPGEEAPGGAEPMIKEGALKNPDVDYVIGLHAGGLFNELKRGTIGFKNGAIMASADKFTLNIVGKGGHGAVPQINIDPIIIAAEVLLGLQKIISRELPPTSSAVLTVAKFTAGSTHNIIPDTAEMVGTVRTTDPAEQDYIIKRILEISDGIAKSYGGKAVLDYERMYPVVMNDTEFTERIKARAKEFFGNDVVEIEKPTMCGEDIAFFLQQVPGTFFMLSNLNPHKDGVCYPHHNAKFDVDESLFHRAIAILLSAVDEYNGI